MKTLVLIGMPGSGKSSVAKLLAKDLSIKLCDIDSEIENGMKETICDIFATKGESFFRTIEQELIMNLFEPSDMILSLGGGAFENNLTQDFLLENSVVIYLKTPVEVLYERIKSCNNRPLLAGSMNKAHLEQLLNKRKNNYQKAHYIVNTDCSIENVIDKIKEIIENV